jgi:hypothetical protein
MAEHVKRLRDCVIAGKKVDMDEMHVIMDGQTIPRGALTNMMMSQCASPKQTSFLLNPNTSLCTLVPGGMLAANNLK